jgi:hypothetical protein
MEQPAHIWKEQWLLIDADRNQTYLPIDFRCERVAEPVRRLV